MELTGYTRLIYGLIGYEGKSGKKVIGRKPLTARYEVTHDQE